MASQQSEQRTCGRPASSRHPASAPTSPIGWCQRRLAHLSRWLVACGTLTVAVVGCGGGGGSDQPAAGHDSPQAAVVGLIAGLSQQDAQKTCNYVLPTPQSRCAFASSISSWSVAGFKLGHAVTNGDRALVTIVVDKLCGNGHCLTNHDPNAGLPSPANGTFDDAFKAAANSPSDPAVTCTRSDGKWFVGGNG